MVFGIPSIFYLVPLTVVGLYIGNHRGFRRELITFLGVAVATVLLWNGPGLLLTVINAFLARFGRIVDILTGRSTRTPLEINLTPEFEPVASILFLCLIVLGAYAVANYIARGTKVDNVSKWFGTLVGGLNVFIVMSRILGYLRQRQQTDLLRDLTLDIPSFPGLRISLSTPPENMLLVNWPLMAIAVLVVSVLVLYLVRSSKT